MLLLLAAPACAGFGETDTPSINVENRLDAPVVMAYRPDDTSETGDEHLVKHGLSELTIEPGANATLRPSPVTEDHCLTASLVALDSQGDVVAALPSGTCFADDHDFVIEEA